MRQRSRLLLLAVVAVLASSAPSALAGGPPWTTIRGNPAHTNSSPGPDPRPPLTLRWSRQFESEVAPRLVVDGLVIADRYDQAAGVWHLLALDEHTGATRWDDTFGNHGLWPHVTYGDGRIYALLVGGTEFELGAYDP